MSHVSLPHEVRDTDSLRSRRMIPDSKRPAIARALEQAFGLSEPEDIAQLTGGLSTARVFRIVVKGRPYVLRLILRDDALSESTRKFGCMKAGAEAGLAPTVRYTSTEDR